MLRKRDRDNVTLRKAEFLTMIEARIKGSAVSSVCQQPASVEMTAASDTVPRVQDLEEVVDIDQKEMIQRQESNSIELVGQDFIRENLEGV